MMGTENDERDDHLDYPGTDGRVEPTIGAVDDSDIVMPKKGSFAGSERSRLMVYIGGALLLVFGAVVVYSYSQRGGTGDRAKVTAAAAKGSGAVESPTPRQQALVKEENQRAAEAAMRDPRGVEVPPYLGAGDVVTPPPTPPPATYPTRMQQPTPALKTGSSVDYLAQLAKSAAAVRELSRTPLGHETAFANATMQPAAIEVTDAADGGGGIFPVGEYLTARLDMGINSDFANQVTAVIMTPNAYRGMRLVGAFDQPDERFARNRVSIRFTSAYTNPYAKPVRLNAVAVEPGARVPALKGKVSYHVLENVVFHLGGAFVQGYASGLATTNFAAVNAGDTGTLVIENPLSPAVTGATRAAGALVSPRGLRPPTVQIPAGTAIGVIVLSQQDTPAQSQANAAVAGHVPPVGTDPMFLTTPLPVTMSRPQ